MIKLRNIGLNNPTRYLKWLLLILVLLGTAGWPALNRWEEARTVTYIIPPGTSQRLAAGQEVVDFPNELIFTIGLQDTLVIENQDDTVHTLGPFVVLPHTTLTKRFNQARVYESVCTFHKNQQMKLIVNPAPWDIWH